MEKRGLLGKIILILAILIGIVLLLLIWQILIIFTEQTSDNTASEYGDCFSLTIQEQKDTCIYNFAITTQNQTLCDLLTGQNKAECFNNFSQRTDLEL